jgi:hypothetical protein
MQLLPVDAHTYDDRFWYGMTYSELQTILHNAQLAIGQ